MRYLLDTVTFIWALRAPERLSSAIRSILTDETVVREISSVSILEMGLKYSNQKLDVSKRAVAEGIAELELRILPFLANHAYEMFELPLKHRDPFDRQIIAQAIFEGVTVITPDTRFDDYGIQRIW